MGKVVWLVSLAGVLTLGLALPGLALRTPPLPGSGFSRGIAIAEPDQREPPAILPWGEETWLAWSDLAGTTLALFLASVDAEGGVREPEAVSLSLIYAGQPQFLKFAGQGWLAFLARLAPEAPRRLYLLPLGPGGEPTGHPLPLTPEDPPGVRSYQALAAGEAIWLAWLDAAGEVWLGRWSPEGGEPQTWQLGPGQGPPALAAQGDTVHLVWPAGGNPSLFPLTYVQATERGISPPVELASFPLPTGAIPTPPAIALEEEWGYCAAGFEYRTGNLAGTAEVWVCAFLLNHPSQASTYQLKLPSWFPDDYPLEAEGLLLAPVPPGHTIRPADLYNPRGIPGGRGVALLSCGAKLVRRGKLQVQPAVVAFQEGRPLGWAPVARSSNFSYFTVLRRSDRGWHVAWLDMLGYGEYRLYYASTAPGERPRLNQLGWDDVAYFAGTVASGLVGGLAFLPLLLVTSVPGLGLLFVHYLRGGEESLRHWWPKALLALAILPFLIVKVVLTGTFGGVPFSPWLSLEAAQAAARVLPFIPSLLGLAALFIYFRRAGEPTLFPAWATFVLADMAFTVLILGPSLAAS